MTSLWQRLLPKIFATTPVQTQPAPTPVASAQTTAPAASQAVNDDTVVLAMGPRRPLIATDGSIGGFEFRIHRDILNRLGQRADQRGRSAYVAAVLTSARLTTQTGRVGFARLALDWLVHAAGVEVCRGIWVGVEQPANSCDDAQLLEASQQVLALRAKGVKVGWENALLPELAPDFVLLHQGAQPMGALLERKAALPAAIQALPTLVTDVICLEDLEKALGQGIHFACGALAPTNAVSDAREFLPVPPEVHRVGLLLNQLVTGVETAAIVSGIKSDVGLSFRLLKRLNSANFAQLKAGASIDQAVVMLGRNELYRWLSLLLVQFAGRRKATSALQEITLWRSRMLELLALENHEASPGQFFTLGLASMLSPILKISLEDVATTLNLPVPARQALLEQAGPWYDYLLTILQVESHQLEDSSALLDRFGGAARVTQLADEAWSWAHAAEHTNHEDTHPA
jgi:EAL and modified HD-GYP domain-containing signal transduction protein